MKKIIFILLLFFHILMVKSSIGQRFQATNGTQLSEGYWEVLEDTDSKAYVTIGNSFSADQLGRLWISSYNSTGIVTSSVSVSNGKRMVARDISIAPKDSTGKNTYYVTGWSQTSVGTTVINQMFVGRMRLNGSFIWYTENPSSATTAGSSKEGISIVTAPNGDAVALGLASVQSPTGASSPKVFLTRFSASGTLMWSNVYIQNGDWLPRSIALGTAAPNCATSPTNMPGSFVITGEVSGSTAGTKATTFASVYNGAGVECWRGLYPATLTLTTFGDAGYDVVLNPATGNYNIVGVAQFGTVRASASSTPYLVEVSPSGSLTRAAVYIKNPNFTPMGLYPRSCILNQANTGAAPSLVFTGPDFGTNKVFTGSVSAVGYAGTFFNYNGLATANVGAQLFMLTDGQPEGISTARLSSNTGYIISTNAAPGAFGAGDGQLIKTNLDLLTPQNCSAVSLTNQTLQSTNSTFTTSTTTAQSGWGAGQTTTTALQILQRFCRDTCIVSSSYTYTVAGKTVTFAGTGGGNGTLSYKWLFGDGNTSNLQNPTYTYAAPGTYNVCLLVYNVNATGDTCATESCKTVTISACDVVANFTYTVACKYKVTFTNTSTGSGTLTYKWLFDDGTTSTVKSTSKTFTTCGRHVTYLITCNATCCDTTSVVVNIPCCEVKSDFCLRDSALYVKLIYNTTMNLSTTTYTVFLDGVQTTWSANTSKLLTPGLHTVCLKASRVSCPGDTCCATCCKQIYVSTPCSLVADFWHQIQTGTGNVVFTNKTTPTGFTSIWEFGDGSPKETTTNPTHTFKPGTYTVCLTTTYPSSGDTCYSRVCKTIYIDSSCKPIAKFKTQSCLTTPYTIEFSNFSTGATNYIWSFGDGSTSSTAVSPTYTYTAPGTYNVCLYASIDGDHCISRACRRVAVKAGSCKTTCDNILPGNRQIQSDENQDLNVSEPIKESKAEGKAEGTKQKVTEEKLMLFPNPASQFIQVIYTAKNKANAELVVVNATGEVMYKKMVSITEGTNQLKIPVQHLASGNYFLKINSSGNSKSALFTVSQ